MTVPVVVGILGFAAAILTAFGVLIGNLFGQITSMRAELAVANANHRDDWKRFQEKHEEDALLRQEARDHIDALEWHIYKGLPPPPPQRPPGI